MQFFKSWSKKLITIFSKNYVLIHYKIMHALLLFCGKFVTICICYGTAASNYQGDIIASYIEKPRRTVCSSKVDFTALKQKALEIQREVKKITKWSANTAFRRKSVLLQRMDGEFGLHVFVNNLLYLRQLILTNITISY